MSYPCATTCPPASRGALRLGAGLLLTAQAMVLALAVNLTPPDDHLTRHLLQSLVLGAAGLVALLLGGPLLLAAGRELRLGRITIELLFLLTAGGAFAASMQSYLTGAGPIYFEVIGVLLVVYAFGQMVIDRQRKSAVTAANAWASSLATARLLDGRVVPVAEVAIGDVIESRPGESIVVDGLIREGIGFVGEAAVNGEPFAAVKRPGDRVLAGSSSVDSLLRIEATAAGTERQVDRLIASVEAARLRPGSLTRQADRLVRVFLPLILITAIVTFVIWSFIDDWRTGLFNSMAVLLVACPCALGLATPLVVWSTLAELARRGFIAHSGDAVERLASVDRVVFDKTGTLTDDAMLVVDLSVAGVDRERLLGWLALVESKCDHPVARAFAMHAGIAVDAVIESLGVVPGFGVDAVLRIDGALRRLRVGRAGWFDSVPVELLDSLRVYVGHRVDVELDGRVVAVAMLSERWRENSAKAIADLKSLGLPVEIWTGAAEPATSTNENKGACPLFWSLSPEDKRRRIGATGGRVLFIGDGLNDAGALAEAHVGIALASGTDLANEAAGLTLTHGNLRTVPQAIELSRAAVASMRRVLLRAAAYNVIGIALAAFGLIHPVAAALLMVVSSTLAAWGAARRITPEAQPTKDSTPFLRLKAVVHAVAFALQGPVWAALFGSSERFTLLLLIFFGLFGSVAAFAWRRAASLSHHLDMTFGMLTLGNLGMLLGWWADHRFTALPTCGCACTLESALTKPWMWLGMLVGCNVAMALLARGRHGSPFAMYVGGNLGMLAGMAVGMGIAPVGILGHFIGMSIGMILGMALGHELGMELNSAAKVRFAVD